MDRGSVLRLPLFRGSHKAVPGSSPVGPFVLLFAPLRLATLGLFYLMRVVENCTVDLRYVTSTMSFHPLR